MKLMTENPSSDTILTNLALKRQLKSNAKWRLSAFENEKITQFKYKIHKCELLSCIAI